VLVSPAFFGGTTWLHSMAPPWLSICIVTDPRDDVHPIDAIESHGQRPWVERLEADAVRPHDQAAAMAADWRRSLRVGLDVLHNDDDLPVRTLRDGVPDSQAFRRKVETVSTRERIFFGKRVGKRRNWFFEQVKDGPVGGAPKRLRQSFELVPGPVREAKDPITH
jgi:hypothetical protein